MDESNEKNEMKMKKIIVRVGYGGQTDETRPVRFTGREVGEASNHTHEGENQTRWHEWTLYLVKDGYRVYDAYITQWRGESTHYVLSDIITPSEVAKVYPALSNEYFDAADVAEDLDEVVV